ncbi:hypothetical protein [Buttiauxella agrestis]|nr:hypothetical protein [Buttiauxella agrestis]
MKKHQILFIPVLLLSGIFNSYAVKAENNITQNYVSSWKAVSKGESVTSLQSSNLGSEVVKSCKTVAPKQFRGEILRHWSHMTGTKVTETAFLSEDLQLFDRLAAISCLEGADYERKGNSDQLVKALSAQLLDMDAKDDSDAYAQIKTMEFQTGIMTARYGISIEKNSLKRGN